MFVSGRNSTRSNAGKAMVPEAAVRTARTPLIRPAGRGRVKVIGTISRQERLAALGEFGRFCQLRLELVPLEAADFDAAARFCDGSEAPLRAGDALHLAVCRRARGSLATMDRGLAAASQEAGLAVELIEA